MMVTLLLYAYCIGERSSRRIERRCQEDIAFRVITANAAPDHSTIARFRQANQEALTTCFTQGWGAFIGFTLVSRAFGPGPETGLGLSVEAAEFPGSLWGKQIRSGG
jgi:hypothetical protein